MGQFEVPGDKSISHRAVIIGSIAKGITRVEGLLRGDDVMRTIQAFQACGVRIEFEDSSSLMIEGVGMDGLSAPDSEIDLGNSGTGIRLLTGLFTGQRFETTFTGDQSLSKRPMRRVADPLRLMGADISLSEYGTPPVRIRPVERLHPIDWQLPVASAQVKSAVILAALYARGQTRIKETIPTRDYTFTMLNQFGANLQRMNNVISIDKFSRLEGQSVKVPGDFSSAAFFIVAALLVPESELVLLNVGVNQNRIGLLSALDAMGADIELQNRRLVGAEAVADIRIRNKGTLTGVEIPVSLVHLMIDEIPILAIAAAVADGRTVLSGCEELRIKESDRIHSVASGLAALGIDVEERPDGMCIEGGQFKGGQVESFGDHRIAMAFAIAGAVSQAEIEVLDCDCVDTSFPQFVSVARNCGIDIEFESQHRNA